MNKPTQHDLEEWQFLVFALRDTGRQCLYINAEAASLIPHMRRWWVEVMMAEYVGAVLKPATQFFTREPAISPLATPPFPQRASAPPLPIVIGGD